MENAAKEDEIKFGATLKAVQKASGMSQGLLSEKTGLSVEAISNLERSLNNPSYVTLEKLSAALQTPIRDFFEVPEGSPQRSELLAEVMVIGRQLSDRNLKNLVELAKTLQDHAE